MVSTVFLSELVNKYPQLADHSPAYREAFLERLQRQGAVEISPTYRQLILQLKTILNRDRAYSDVIDRFVRVNIEPDNSISGTFLDGRKLIDFRIKDNKLTYKLSKTSRIDSEVREDGRRKKSKCTKGIPCKNSCISSKKSCVLPLSEVASPGEVAKLRSLAVNLKLERNAANTIAKTPQPAPTPDYVNNPETGQEYTIRDLKKVASNEGVTGYSSMTKEQLQSALRTANEAKNDPTYQENLAKTLTKDRSSGSRAIKASGITGKERRSAQDANRTWRNLNALAKFAGSQPVGWGAAAIGAFMLGVTIRSYERAKSDYRMHFKEAAEQAEEKASTLGSTKNGALKRTGAYKNITFIVSAGKGYGAEEVQKQLEKFQSSDDEGDQWLGKNHFFVPFNLKEGGARKEGSDIENSINGLQDYIRNFRRGKDQDAVDLAAQIYGYGIQRQLKTRYQNELEGLDRRYKTLSQQRSANEPLISNLKEVLDQSVRDLKVSESAYKKNPTNKALERELRLKSKKQAEAKLKFDRVNVKFQEIEKNLKANRSQHGKISSRPDSGARDLANKGKNINILAHSRGGQTSKTALEYLARMQLKGEPSGKEVLEQVNLVMLGTPHFGFTENVSKRQRTIISARDPISTLPVFGEGARQQWVSTVKGHDWKDYLEDKNVREALRENFGYYEDSLLERTRRERKGDSEEVILDAKKPLCKTGKPCVGESGKTICIPKSHKCATDKVKTPENPKLKFAPPPVLIGVAATAGIGLVATGSVVAGATHVVKKDLEKSEVDFNSIRQPPGGKPDEETFKKYDTFEKGDLIRKNFKSDDLGIRQHYAVYMGKTIDPKTGEKTHWCIDTGEDWKHRDKVPFVMARGLTWNSGPNDSEYEKVPKEEMHLVKGTKQLSREEIADRAEKMLYQRFHYQGFESNCEAFARGIVEGKAYSQQGMQVSPLTNFASKVVTDNVLKIRTNQNKILGEWEGQLAKLESQGLGDSPEGKKLKADIKGNKAQQARFGIGEEKTLFKLGGNEVTGLTEYAKDKYKMTAQQMVDYLEREKVMQERRKWEDLINPYEGTYEKGYLGRKEESGVLGKGYPDRKNRNLEGTRLGFRPFSFLVKNTRQDSELSEFFDAIGLKSPEEIESIAEAIAKELPAIGDYIKIEIYKNYLLALFGILTQDSEEIKLDAKSPECKTGKACKAESGKAVCIPKTHKCSSEISPNDKKTLAIAGGGIVAGAAMVAAYAAARDILTTIDTESIERNGNTVLTKDKVRDIKLEKKIGEQGATSDTYFVRDSGQQRYVFKQSKPIFYNQAASEVVVSEMALKAGINVNKTKLLPIDVEHPLKDSGRAATLHSVASGKTLREVKSLPELPLSQKNGLDRTIIKSISHNPELAKIAALDTFTGNWDRNPGNIFYDDKKQSFQGIDLGASYNRAILHKSISPSLAAKSRESLKKIDVGSLSESEKQGLNTYLGTLKTLYTDNPPSEITKRHAKYLKLSGGNWDLFRRYVSVKQIFDDHKESGRLIYDLEKKLNSRTDSVPKCKVGKLCDEICIPKANNCRSDELTKLNPVIAGGGAALLGLGAIGAVTINKATSTSSDSSLNPGLKQQKQYLEGQIETSEKHLSFLKKQEIKAKEAFHNVKSPETLAKYKCAFLNRTTKADDIFNLKFNITSDAHKAKKTEPAADTNNNGKKVFIARHGEREDYATPGYKAPRRYDNPLSDNGHKQAREMAVSLKNKGITEIHSSPFLRTMQTANAVAEELNLPIKVNQGMAEWYNPKWFSDSPKPMAAEELQKLFPRVDTSYSSEQKPRYPESSDDVLNRSGRTVSDAISRSAGNVLLVGHGPTVIGGSKSLTKNSPIVLPQFAGVVELENQNGEWKNKGLWHPSENKKPADCRSRADSVAATCKKGKPCKTKSGGTVCIPKTYKCSDEKEGVTLKSRGISNVALGGAIALGLGGALVGGIAIKEAFKPDVNIIRREEDLVFDKKTPPKEKVLNGIPLESTNATSYLKTPENKSFTEPEFPKNTKTKKAGVVVIEPDGRFWIMEPLNHVGGVHNFAKGTVEEGLTIQQNALKEAKEELGLDVKIVDRLGDFGDNSGNKYTSDADGSKEAVARYYIGIRTGGTPNDAHWEADKVKLVSSDTARQLFRKGKDHRDYAVIKSAADYTSEEESRTKLVEAFTQSEKSAKSRANWKPKMGLKEAQDWAKDSVYKEELYHGTSKQSADGIEKEGFKTNIKLWGSYYGRGVYTGRDLSDIKPYFQKHKDNGAVLRLKANLENVLYIDKEIDAATSNQKERDYLQNKWGPSTMHHIARRMNFEEDFNQAVEREKKRKIQLSKELKLGYITQQQYNERVSDKPESEAFSQLIQRAGYDAVTYKDTVFQQRNEFLVFDAKKLTAIGRVNKPKFDSEGIPCGKGFISRGEKCNSGMGALRKAGQSFRQTLTSATQRSGNSLRKTGQVAQGITSPDKTPDVVRKAARNVKNSTLQSIKEDPDLIKELIGVAKNNPDFVKGLIDMEMGKGSKTIAKASIKDAAARKALAKIALKPKIHKSLFDLVRETVGYIVRKDSETSTDYVLGFVFSRLESAIREDAKGKKCGKGYIPARAKCKVGLGANIKRPQMNQSQINTALAATGAIAGVAALGVAGGSAVAVSANNLKQAKVERELAQIQRERAEEALKKAEELAKKKEEEEKEEARTLKQEVVHSLKKVGASALGAGVPLGFTGGPAAGFAGAGIAATKTGIEETARIVRKRKTKKSELAAEVLESIAPGFEEGLKTSGTKKQKLKAFTIASATKANEKAIDRLNK